MWLRFDGMDTWIAIVVLSAFILVVLLYFTAVTAYTRGWRRCEQANRHVGTGDPPNPVRRTLV